MRKTVPVRVRVLCHRLSRSLLLLLALLIVVVSLTAVSSCAKPKESAPPMAGPPPGMAPGALPPPAPSKGAMPGAKGPGGPGGGPGGPPAGAMEKGAARAGAVQSSDAVREETPAPGGSEPPAAPDSGRQVIKTAELTVEVDKVADAEGKVKRLAERAGGFVDSLNSRIDADGHQYTDVTVRVPVAQFRGVLDGIRGIGKVKQGTEKGEDVTMQMVDLDSRIRNLSQEEARILDLYKRTTQMADILKVEQELTRVRGQIEEAQGRMRAMKDQVSFSTITVHLQEPAVAALQPETWSFTFELRSAARRSLQLMRGFVGHLVWFAVVDLPWLILIGLIVWLFVRSARRRRPPSPPQPPQGPFGPLTSQSPPPTPTSPAPPGGDDASQGAGPAGPPAGV